MWYRAFDKHNFFKTISKILMVMVIFALTGCDHEASDATASYSRSASCWQAYILNACVKIVDHLFDGASQKVANGGATLVMVGFAVWLAFKMLKVLSSFKEESIGEVWTEIGHKLFLCGFCAFGVYSTANLSWMVSTFIIPVYNSFLELSSRVIDMKTENITLGDFGSTSYIGVTSTCTATADIDSIKNSILPMAQCLVCNITQRLNAGIKVGTFLIGNASVAGMFIGLIILVCFLCAKFGFVLYLVDALFRVNFAVILVPIFIMGIPFPFTRKWSLQAFLMFINSSGVMLFMGLLVSVAVNSLQTIMRYIGPDLSEGNTDGMGPIMMAMLMISLLLFNIPGFAITLADKFFQGGGSPEASKKISKFVIDLAKRVGYAALSKATQGITETITDKLQEYEKIREMMDSAKQKMSKINNKINEIAGYND